MLTGYRGPDMTICNGGFSVVVAELSRVLIERRHRNAAGDAGVDCCPDAAYARVWHAVDECLRHSWQEAEAREAALPMWTKTPPTEDTPTARWRKEWAGFWREEADGMHLSWPRTRAAVPGAAEAVATLGTRVLATTRVVGTTVSLVLQARQRLAPVPIGRIDQPAAVLAGAATRASQPTINALS